MLKKLNHPATRWGLLVLGLLLTGCGKAEEGPAFELVPVKGIVKAGGQPLADATVSFYPQGTPTAGFYGAAAKTDASGGYVLLCGNKPGAVVGKYKVTVSRVTKKDGSPVADTPGMDLQQLKMQGQAIESVPPAFSDPTATQLTTTVEATKADGYDFEVQL